MNLFEPFEFLKMGIGARLDHTTWVHIIIGSGSYVILTPFYAWRLGSWTQAKRAWFWTMFLIICAVELEQGRDYVVLCEPRSFLDLIELIVPNGLNYLLMRFVLDIDV